MGRRMFALLLAACTPSATGLTVQGSDVPPKEPLRLGNTGKSMHVEGHTVSEVSARWGGNVVYAIFTSKYEKYHNNLLTQLATWAERPASEGRYVAVGGNDYPEGWLKNGTVLKSICDDSMIGISCKEATLLAEGAARGAAWLVITGEDNYVNTRFVDTTLQGQDPDEPVTFGCIGCGKGDKQYCRDSPTFQNKGGLCGGCGYILSRAALRLLLSDGAPALHKVYDAATSPNDMTTSCLLRKNNVRLSALDGFEGYPIFRERELLHYTENGFMTLHYITPAVMHWLHAVVEHKESDVIERMERQAFDRGCVTSMNNSFWFRDVNACISEWDEFQEELQGLRKRATALSPS